MSPHGESMATGERPTTKNRKWTPFPCFPILFLMIFLADRVLPLAVYRFPPPAMPRARCRTSGCSAAPHRPSPPLPLLRQEKKRQRERRGVSPISSQSRLFYFALYSIFLSLSNLSNLKWRAIQMASTNPFSLKESKHSFSSF